MNLFENSLFEEPAATALRLAGAISPQIVNTFYPMEALTAWHCAHHIKGLTGRWMDGGANYLTGITRGSFHRLAHGHHLFEDGFKVLVNPDLKFGQFLHHLGLDSLTTRGIPNPLLPTMLLQPLVQLGFSPTFVNELLTVNVPKILGGSLALACSGRDVYLAFSDAIPHTFSAAGQHFMFGALDIGFGLYPPNFLMLLAGAGEIGVGIFTAYRAVVEPVLPVVNVPASVYFPLLGNSLLLASVLGACVAYWSGATWEDTGKVAAIGAAAVGMSTTVSLAMTGAGFIAPFLGAGAGIATALVLRQVLLRSNAPEGTGYVEWPDFLDVDLFPQQAGIPLFGCPDQPIGSLQGDRLLLDEQMLARMTEALVA